jgi:hypothetical protein
VTRPYLSDGTSGGLPVGSPEAFAACLRVRAHWHGPDCDKRPVREVFAAEREPLPPRRRLVCTVCGQRMRSRDPERVRCKRCHHLWRQMQRMADRIDGAHERDVARRAPAPWTIKTGGR